MSNRTFEIGNIVTAAYGDWATGMCDYLHIRESVIEGVDGIYLGEVTNTGNHYVYFPKTRTEEEADKPYGFRGRGFNSDNTKNDNEKLSGPPMLLQMNENFLSTSRGKKAAISTI
tara:strand:+ start:70 stop:414 length:345 start_codon:yes stop_codon:yes gene_type:complete